MAKPMPALFENKVFLFFTAESLRQRRAGLAGDVAKAVGHLRRRPQDQERHDNNAEQQHPALRQMASLLLPCPPVITVLNRHGFASCKKPVNSSRSHNLRIENLILSVAKKAFTKVLRMH
jgi:hypothetical protein